MPLHYMAVEFCWFGLFETTVSGNDNLFRLDEDILTIVFVVCVQYDLRISAPSMSQLEVTFMKKK